MSTKDKNDLRDFSLIALMIGGVFFAFLALAGVPIW
jgi:hypothetical protein